MKDQDLTSLRLKEKLLWNMVNIHNQNLKESIEIQERQRVAIEKCLHEINLVTHEIQEIEKGAIL